MCWTFSTSSNEIRSNAISLIVLEATSIWLGLWQIPTIKHLRQGKVISGYIVVMDLTILIHPSISYAFGQTFCTALGLISRYIADGRKVTAEIINEDPLQGFHKRKTFHCRLLLKKEYYQKSGPVWCVFCQVSVSKTFFPVEKDITLLVPNSDTILTLSK